MKLLGQLSVFPVIPERIARLGELSYNLCWAWHPTAATLFRDLDSDLWEATGHNPVRLLHNVAQARLDAAAADPNYLARYDQVMADIDAYMHSPSTWFSRECAGAQNECIAYFSAEFGLHESLPIYSGGLGILAGDHCKAASDLGLPLVGIGFLYPQGYFRQLLDPHGWQQASYEKIDLAEAPARPALDASGAQVIVSVELPGRIVRARVWRIQVGRIDLYLLDTDVPQNAPGDRELAARLYQGDQEIRLAQEFVLGIGGVRAVRALGLNPTVWHMNEGHCAFLVLERARELVGQGLSFAAAREIVAANTVFTTHTPVPAGNDAFNFDLIDRYFGQFWPRLQIDRETFLNLGRYEFPWGAQFSMTALALRLSGGRNGVSALHGAVSRQLWQAVWPETPAPEVPICAITNGVHTESWLAPELAALYDQYLGDDWRERLEQPQTWEGVKAIPDHALWEAHCRLKQRMIAAVRARMHRQRARHGEPQARLAAAAELLDPEALTIGFARRFATYKRATLLLQDQQRLRSLLTKSERPVQILFAGKAHPADEDGKRLIQRVFQLAQEPEFQGRIVFVEDYDMNLARYLVQGVDLWLNTPRRPNEASGTSGQKAALNGVPNCSASDGWWPEAYNGRNGWIFGEARESLDPGVQDEADSRDLYRVLEEEIVPLFFERDEDGIPHGWIRVMREALQTITPVFSTRRMVEEYVQHLYLPAAARWRKMTQDGYVRGQRLAAWRARAAAAWPKVVLRTQGPTEATIRLGQTITINADVALDNLTPDDVIVEMVYGRQTEEGLTELQAIPMTWVSEIEPGWHRYQAMIQPTISGKLGYGVRVLAAHPDLPDKFDARLVRWA